jgi:ketosteroid isomerase-like protein
MSEENVNALRRSVEVWNRDGPSEAAVALVHPDSVVYAFREWPDEAVYRGRQGWLRLMEQWTENFDDITWEIEKVIDDDPTVALLVNHRAIVKGTGVPLVQPLGLVARFQDGMVIEGRFFLTWNEALEAAGLPE